MVVVVPGRAEFEPGFGKALRRLHMLSKELGSPILFYSNTATLTKAVEVFKELEHNLPIKYQALDDWEDFLVISRDVAFDDLLIIMSARKNTVSYNRLFDKLPKQLTRYFENNNVLMLYPEQF